MERERDKEAFEAETKGRYSVVVCITRATNTNWQAKLLDTRKVTQLNVLRQVSVKSLL